MNKKPKFETPNFNDGTGENSRAVSPTRQLLREARTSKLPAITRRTTRVGGSLSATGEAKFATLLNNSARCPTVKFSIRLPAVKPPLAQTTVEFIRICAFCNRKGSYNSFPNGSVAAAGIFACGDCLRLERTAAFREAFEIEVEEVGRAEIDA